MADFDKFDKMINKDELQKQMDAAPEFDDVPKGTYICNIENMEVKPTKKQDKLMLAVQMGIIETVEAPKKQDKRKIFMNRTICGNKSTEKWNDGVAIKGVITWLEKLLDDGDTIEFTSYTDFADEVLDIFQSVCPKIEVKVDYDPDGFNTIDIVEVYDK